MKMRTKRGTGVVLALLLVATGAAGQVSFGTPVPLGAPVNSSYGEGSPSLTADGLEMYFNSNRPGGHGAVDLWVTTRPTLSAEWEEPENLGPVVNSQANELAAAVSPDGLELYFCDWGIPLEGGHGKSDLWVSRRTSRSGAWGTPVNLGPIINTSGQEATPELSPDGLEMYYETDRAGGAGHDDLWVTRRPSTGSPWQEPEWLGSTINIKGMDHCPTLTGDGLTMFYDQTPPEQAPVGNLMVTTRRGLAEPWSDPVNLGHEFSGHYASEASHDGNTLYFSSRRPGGEGDNDLWRVRMTYE